MDHQAKVFLDSSSSLIAAGAYLNDEMGTGFTLFRNNHAAHDYARLIRLFDGTIKQGSSLGVERIFGVLA